jgi:hypothetical protein
MSTINVEYKYKYINTKGIPLEALDKFEEFIESLETDGSVSTDGVRDAMAIAYRMGKGLCAE